MSRGVRLSVLGLYHYKNTLFDSMVFPNGFTQDDKETVISNILAECAELECLYPNFDTLKTMIEKGKEKYAYEIIELARQISEEK